PPGYPSLYWAEWENWTNFSNDEQRPRLGWSAPAFPCNSSAGGGRFWTRVAYGKSCLTNILEPPRLSGPLPRAASGARRPPCSLKGENPPQVAQKTAGEDSCLPRRLSRDCLNSRGRSILRPLKTPARQPREGFP